MENPSSVSLMGVAASGKAPSRVFAGSCGAPSDNNDKQNNARAKSTGDRVIELRFFVVSGFGWML